ncbi:MAG: formylglycine-generating enzyme family protein, partial [Gammaproteobacteria bacterium]|nr:formylglycine-generating enzyme family protein [Gammaproteobacteria bacterium]
MDAGEYIDLISRFFPRPDWASNFGVDGIGIWAEFECRGVRQRMRWIAPGEFLMGSPKDEHERRNNETQHEVMLTRGYWLAETACKQALWQAVMGDNPSEFKGEQNPVEQVSWEQVQKFIGKLNDLCPGLGLRLPSEAEWEYACRAGTEGPFSVGEDIDPTQVNYDGN